MGTVLRLSEIPTDRPLSEALYDFQGNLVIDQGAWVTDAQLEDLAHRGLAFLELGGPVAPVGETPAAAADEKNPLDKHRNPAATSAGTSIPAPVADAGSTPAGSDKAAAAAMVKPRRYNSEVTLRVSQLAQRAADVVGTVGAALVEGTIRDAAPINDVAAAFLAELDGDADQVVSESTSSPYVQALAARSVQMSVLSMAICRAMGLPDHDCLCAGSAAMLHDTALFCLPEDQRYPHAMMQAHARRVYDSHPSLAYYMLEKVASIDSTVRIVVLQVHEQLDGSGYPRGTKTPRIHPLARVLNVADAYIRLVSCSGDGQRLYPADAIAYLMYHACAARFDAAAVSGLIKAVSLYPLGSLVRLTNEATARVIRCNQDFPLQPVVTLPGNDEPVDLATGNVRVDVPADVPRYGRRRLPKTEFSSILW